MATPRACWERYRRRSCAPRASSSTRACTPLAGAAVGRSRTTWPTCPSPEGFLASEIDRYIVMPGQALSYLIGKRELVRMRDDAGRHLGSRFELPEFHAAVLDGGSLPMPVLEEKLRRWAGRGGDPDSA